MTADEAANPPARAPKTRVAFLDPASSQPLTDGGVAAAFEPTRLRRTQMTYVDGFIEPVPKKNSDKAVSSMGRRRDTQATGTPPNVAYLASGTGGSADVGKYEDVYEDE